MSYQPVPIREVEGVRRGSVTDDQLYDIQKEILIQLKLISIKLNCLQPFDELNEDDLDPDE